MKFSKSTVFATLLILFFTTSTCKEASSKLFREYIGVKSESIKLSHLPINPKVEFHMILAFAIDYSSLENPSPTNGKFNPFWASTHITPKEIASIKGKYPNVKIALSLGGDSVGNKKAYFKPKPINSWVQNAISSLTHIIQHYNLDGIDIDYEHFKSDPKTFSECIGRLIKNLKESGTISFASIAPYDDDEVQTNYLALWEKYGNLIDYVNFQFYAYDKINPSEFVRLFNKQVHNYGGGQILASFISEDGNHGGLSPEDGFFEACKELSDKQKLGGIFIWSADDSRKHGFKAEKESQAFLA